MAKVTRDEQGRVVLVESDEKVTDPNSPEAVQVPEGVQSPSPLEVHDQESPNEVSGDEPAANVEVEVTEEVSKRVTVPQPEASEESPVTEVDVEDPDEDE
jgi:hypothetical protein